MTRPDIPVTISGDPRGFEAALSRMRNAAGTAVNGVMASFARIKMAATSPMALAASLGVTGVVAAAKEAASAIAEIGDQAKMAGLSAKAFQEWKYVAEQARIPVDAITDALKELSLRADEFATTGQGSAAEAFQRLGLTPQQVKEKLKDPSELLLLLIERTRRLGDTAAGIRIFDELLGGSGGERMVSLIEQGEVGIRNQIKAANDFGRVMSDEMIAKAVELDRQFNAVATTVGTTLKQAIVSAASAMSQFVQLLLAVEQKSQSGIENALALSRKSLAAAEKRKAEMPAFMAGPFDKQIEKNKQEIANLEGELKRRATDNMRMMLLSQKAELAGKDISKGGRLPASGDDKKKTKTGGNKGGGSGSRENEYEREIAQIRERTAAMQAETAAQAGINPLIDDYGFAVEYARAKQELLTAAQKAGVAITPELTAEVNGLALAYANSAVASEQLAEKQDEIRRRAEEALSTAKDVFKGIADDALAGAKASDILANALKRIGDTLLNDVLDSIFSIKNATGGGSGLFGNLLGGLFGGGGSGGSGLSAGLFAQGGAFDASGLTPFAKGGAFTNGIVNRPTVFPFAKGVGLMGEAGPEAIMPLSRDSSGRLGVALHEMLRGGPEAAPTVNFAPVYNVQGSGPEIDRLLQQMAQDKRDLPAVIIKTYRQAKATRNL